MILTVKRQADKEIVGDDIVDELLSTQDVARERGRNELDEHSTNKSEKTLDVPFENLISIGELVEVADTGQAYKSKVTSVSIAINFPDVNSTISLERPL